MIFATARVAPEEQPIHLPAAGTPFSMDVRLGGRGR